MKYTIAVDASAAGTYVTSMITKSSQNAVPNSILKSAPNVIYTPYVNLYWLILIL